MYQRWRGTQVAPVRRLVPGAVTGFIAYALVWLAFVAVAWPLCESLEWMPACLFLTGTPEWSLPTIAVFMLLGVGYAQKRYERSIGR